jgi:drug/metabolite transporter (DMT)-like permease
MVLIYLVLAIVSAVGIWIIGRRVMHVDGDPKVQGFWVSIVGLILSFLILLVRGKSFFIQPIMISGFITSISSAIGFLWIIMYCLKIGPSGLTLTVNNSMLVLGVLYGILFLNPHVPHIMVIAGIIGTVSGLILIGISASKDSTGPRSISPKWIKLVMAGSLLSGVSFINQAYIGMCHPGIDASLVYLFWTSIFTASILFVLVKISSAGILQKKETLSGLSIGILADISLLFTILSINHIGPEIVFPVVVASPMVIMLLVGHFIYGEKLKTIPLIGAVIVIISVILLSIYQ